MSPLETILLASPSKPIVQPPTHRLLTEVLADLTFMYGNEKGCEGLADLWKKIKLPQESERVSSHLAHTVSADNGRAFHYRQNTNCMLPTPNHLLHPTPRPTPAAGPNPLSIREPARLINVSGLPTPLYPTIRTIFAVCWKSPSLPKKVHESSLKHSSTPDPKTSHRNPSSTNSIANASWRTSRSRIKWTGHKPKRAGLEKPSMFIA